jgi:hypothetical protein
MLDRQTVAHLAKIDEPTLLRSSFSNPDARGLWVLLTASACGRQGVRRGIAQPGANWDRILQEVREERLESVLNG